MLYVNSFIGRKTMTRYPEIVEKVAFSRMEKEASMLAAPARFVAKNVLGRGAAKLRQHASTTGSEAAKVWSRRLASGASFTRKHAEPLTAGAAGLGAGVVLS